MKAKDLIKRLQSLDPEAKIMVGDADNDSNGYSENFDLVIYDEEEDLRVNDGHPYVYLEAVFGRNGVVEHTKEWSKYKSK